MATELPIDTHAGSFIAVSLPEPVIDFETKQPKADANGEPMFTVSLAWMRDGSGELIKVKTAGEPSVTPGVPVRVTDLIAMPWAMNGKSGVSFRAAAIVSLALSPKAG